MAKSPNILKPIIFIVLVAFLFYFGRIINIYSPTVIFGALGLFILFFLTLYDVRWGMFVLIFLVIFSPELLLSKEDIAGRAMTFRLDDLIIITIIFGWLAKMAFLSEEVTWKRSPVNMIMLLFLLINILSSINGVAHGTVSVTTTLLFTLKKIEYAFIFFLVLNNIEKIKDVKFFFMLSLLVCGLTCLWGFGMIFVGQMPERFHGPFDLGEANTIASYFVMNLCLTLSMIVHYKFKVRSIPFYLLAVMIIVPFFLTFSRGGYIALAAGVLTLTLFKGYRILLIPLASFAIFFKVLLPQKILDRIFSINTLLTQETVGMTSWDDRLGMWEKAIRKWKMHPILGNGPGSFDLGGVDNQYFMELTSIGIVGFVIFILLLFVALYTIIKVIRNTDDNFIKHLSIGLFAGTVAYMVNGITLSVFILIRTMEPFWFHMGLICFVYRKMKADEDEPNKQPEFVRLLPNQ
ncbi:MAG: hypothetical protein P9M13_11065 [Candidatus Ancaeobacter aquaticus]|nr:hypothetical protein [Candidatus Ancaeobacter aquaticus]